MIREHHVIARPRSNGTVLMQHVFTNPRLGTKVHRVTFQINDHPDVIIWWPERLTLEVETAQNELCVQALKERFQGHMKKGGK